MDTERDIREVVVKYSGMLYRICIVMLCANGSMETGR